jgi:hypothetical protein
MCGPNPPVPPTPVPPVANSRGPVAPRNSPSNWHLKATAHLAKKVNPLIVTTMKNNQLVMSNISDNDLNNLQFLTNNANNNFIGRLNNFGVSIKGNNGSLVPVNIPGLSQVMTGIYDKSDIEASLNNNKTHSPFENPFPNASMNLPSTNGKSLPSASMSVGDYVDTLTAMNPSLPSTSGQEKTYTMTCGSTNLDINFNLKTPGSHTQYESRFGTTISRTIDGNPFRCEGVWNWTNSNWQLSFLACVKN